MTQEEIIQAFENFVRKQGEGVILYNNDGSVIKLQDVIDLIVEQQAEIEKCHDMKFAQEHCNLYEENKWLKVELRHQIEESDKLKKQYERTNAELIKSLGEIAILEEMVSDLNDDLEHAYIIERANIQAEIADAGTSCHWCMGVTVKNTIKKILQAYGYSLSKRAKDDIKKYYGVEEEV